MNVVSFRVRTQVLVAYLKSDMSFKETLGMYACSEDCRVIALHIVFIMVYKMSHSLHDVQICLRARNVKLLKIIGVRILDSCPRDH
jgi:hypothetical protein